MVDRILNILKLYENIDYKIKVNEISRVENYYVKKELEINRVIETIHIYLTVYKVFEENGIKYRGSSSSEIHPTMNDDEIKKIIEDSIFASDFVKNEYYDLVPKQEEVVNIDLKNIDLNECIEELAEAFYEEDNYDNGYVSYSEFFVYKIKSRILNSIGNDVTFYSYGIDGETSVIWKENNKEVEVYDNFSLANCDKSLLKEKIKDLFLKAERKAVAVAMPKIEKDTNILISGQYVKDFFMFFYENSNAENVYSKISNFKKGESIQEKPVGDKINMGIDPFLKDSNKSAPYDSDGFPLKKFNIIEDGKLIDYWGSKRFCDYLKVEPTGHIENFVVTGGTHSEEDLRKEKYLELVSFSDFTLDTVSGDFGSEIRLGYYFDGEKIISVTGGSISGNINKVISDIKMSKDLKSSNDFYGPATISFRNVNI